MKKNKPSAYHLEIQTHRVNPIGLIRSSYREEGKIKHLNLGRLTGLTMEQLRYLQKAFQYKLLPDGEVSVSSSREYGASLACFETIKGLGLDSMIYSRTSEPWVRSVLAMITGRIVYAGSKLALTRRGNDSALWEICGIEGEIDVEKCSYEPMDRLLSRQEEIQKKLIKKHLSDGNLILYDITSSYMEGDYEDSLLVEYGYNRDEKKNHKQIVIGLLCTKEGCPVAVEVFPGNTNDGKTVIGKIRELREKYGLKKITFVGDRGMVTQANYNTLHDEDHTERTHLRKSENRTQSTQSSEISDGFSIISALTHRDIKRLLKEEKIQMGLFDERGIVEVADSDNPKIRYCLCKNPLSAERETMTREALLNKTRDELEKIAKSPRKNTAETIGVRVGKVLNRYRCGKFVNFEVKEGKLIWSFDLELIEKEKSLDGCYIIYTDVEPEMMNSVEVVKAYKNLINVEQAFRNIKTAALEIRPIYHKTDQRIRSHVFICMLAYYVFWHIKKALKPLLKKEGVNPQDQFTMEYVIERLKSIRKEEFLFKEKTFKILTTPDPEQLEILKLLGITL